MGFSGNDLWENVIVTLVEPLGCRRRSTPVEIKILARARYGDQKSIMQALCVLG
jgi:hypothetical protein